MQYGATLFITDYSIQPADLARALEACRGHATQPMPHAPPSAPPIKPDLGDYLDPMDFSLSDAQPSTSDTSALKPLWQWILMGMVLLSLVLVLSWWALS